jgi:hypothetical protein
MVPTQTVGTQQAVRGKVGSELGQLHKEDIFDIDSE